MSESDPSHPVHPLPASADLDQLRRRAKELLAACREGEAAAVAEFAARHPRFGDPQAVPREARLADAQLVIARRYGESTWAKLRDRVEALRLDGAARRERFVRLASGDLSTASDLSMRRAVAMLEAHPELVGGDVWCDLVTGRPASVLEAIADDPGFATRPGGPRDWPPLLYVAFSRLHRLGRTHRAGMLEIAAALLDAGADPNASFTAEPWDDCPLPALYGACGVTNFPELAALLLDRGATIDDNESLYHSLELDDLTCFELLLSRGVRTEGTNALNHAMDYRDPSRVRRLLAYGADPNEPFADYGTSLHVAIQKGVATEVIELLLDHGAEIMARRPDGRTPYQVALQTGHGGAAALLEGRGGVVEAGPVDRFMAACGRGDLAGARAVVEGEPGVLASMSEAERRVVHEWAKRDRAEAIATALAAGFWPDARGVDGETPLHQAAWFGSVAACRALLDGGAALEAVEPTFGCTPLGWAAHGSDNWPNPDGDYLAVVELLLDAGAKLDPLNRWGEGLIALAGGRDDIADRLRAAGAPEPEAEVA